MEEPHLRRARHVAPERRVLAVGDLVVQVVVDRLEQSLVADRRRRIGLSAPARAPGRAACRTRRRSPGRCPVRPARPAAAAAAHPRRSPQSEVRGGSGAASSRAFAPAVGFPPVTGCYPARRPGRLQAAALTPSSSRNCLAGCPAACCGAARQGAAECFSSASTNGSPSAAPSEHAPARPSPPAADSPNVRPGRPPALRASDESERAFREAVAIRVSRMFAFVGIERQH